MVSWAVSSTRWANPLTARAPVNAEGYNPIEKQAPGILERQSVDTPLHTGILAIDSCSPSAAASVS